MDSWTTIPSPLGALYLSSGESALTGLWFEGQRHFPAGLTDPARERPDLPVFRQAAGCLETYFAGRPLLPDMLPPLSPRGTAFQRKVWTALLAIPYGQTRSYGDLAAELGASPRAVGGAVGRNPISILIPCHRAIGADGSLTGYAGGVEKKKFLLELERRSLEKREKLLYLPTAENDISPREAPAPPAPVEGPPVPGKFPCPCCGYRTFPVPREEAVAFICPVCFWENDVFDPGEDQPSDENHGMTLRQGREVYRKLGAVREDLVRYVRRPLPEEIP